HPLASAHAPGRFLLIKLDIVNAVVTKTNIRRTKAEQAVETVFESLKTALGRGQRIELRKFGVFSVKPRKTGIGRNPRTGEEVSIPPGKAVRFKPGKEHQCLKDPPARQDKKPIVPPPESKPSAPYLMELPWWHGRPPQGRYYAAD